MGEVWLVWWSDDLSPAPRLDSVWDSEAGAVAHVEWELGAERVAGGDLLWVAHDDDFDCDDEYRVERRPLMHADLA